MFSFLPIVGFSNRKEQRAPQVIETKSKWLKRKGIYLKGNEVVPKLKGSLDRQTQNMSTDRGHQATRTQSRSHLLKHLVKAAAPATSRTWTHP